jgi:uncharacterized protein (DUF427 family)
MEVRTQVVTVKEEMVVKAADGVAVAETVAAEVLQESSTSRR